MKKIVLFVAALVTLFIVSGISQAAEKKAAKPEAAKTVIGLGSVATAPMGKEVSNPQIRDAEDNPATIPDFGTHVVGLTYSDTGASDLGDALNDAVKAKKYDKALYRGLGVANMKDSAAPNFIIRSVIKDKIKKYNSTILTDVDLTLPKTWGLGDCKDKSVFVLIGKDKKVKYLKFTDKNTPWKQAEINAVLSMIDDLLKKK
jgi:hypothetical protein